jgi:hypothetical protein
MRAARIRGLLAAESAYPELEIERRVPRTSVVTPDLETGRRELTEKLLIGASS